MAPGRMSRLEVVESWIWIQRGVGLGRKSIMVKIGCIAKWTRSERTEVKCQVERKGNTKEIQKAEKTLQGEMQEKILTAAKQEAKQTEMRSGETAERVAPILTRRLHRSAVWTSWFGAEGFPPLPTTHLNNENRDESRFEERKCSDNKILTASKCNTAKIEVRSWADHHQEVKHWPI